MEIKNKNVVFITIDSCRYDTAKHADIPTIKGMGPLRKAYTHGSYTVPAHISFFSGHLPAVLDEPKLPYYSESEKQLWRIKTGIARDSKPTGLSLEGNNVLEGYKKLGYYVLGVGGVTQFSDGSLLRSYFGEEFLYYGFNLDEELLSPRFEDPFPLNHIDEIVKKIEKYDRWFLFLNCPETHYPYDHKVGQNIPKYIIDQFPKLMKAINLRESENSDELSVEFGKALHNMQKEALESIDQRLQVLFESLPKNRDILTVICSDHGDNFGEYFVGKRRWGHLFPSPEVMQVPLIIGELK